VRRRSARQEALYEQRRPFVERILAERPLCEACPVFAREDGAATYIRYPSCDVHELVRRSQGGSILDDRNVLAVCRRCHDTIGKRPAEAERLGLALPSWADDELVAEAAARRSGGTI
jgi:5-methylcytosine-specific restriction endonuclease McrA